ncbi:MAG: hypothetical protein IKM18_09825 [Clostridia bacterium]|nr:hypothetical protein [Clostridia bacterium]
MKKHNIRTFGLCILILYVISFALSGCSENETTYELLHDKSEISNVYLVPADNIDSQKVTCDINDADVIEITDIDKFLSELNKLVFYKHVFGDPETVSSDRAVYILYSNGDREFIHHLTQNCIKNGELICRRLICWKVSFDKFIGICTEISEK